MIIHAMIQRAYSTFEIKAIDEEQRIIEGIASTPEPDRYDDIVEPMGAEFTLPIPFLWQHESREAAIGEVFWAQPTPEGIPVKIRIESDDVPGPLKDRLDYAWRAIKKKLVRGLSIGFVPKESANIEGTWGRRFLRWDWMELSAVTIPANAPCTITTVKSFDLTRRAASGLPTVRIQPPGVPGPAKSTATLTPGVGPMKIAEQIRSLEATRQAKAARMMEVQKAASDAGNTKDEAQREEFNTLADEIKAIDEELKDLRQLESLNLEAATPVAGAKPEEASQSRSGRPVVHAGPELAKGIRFARVAKALGVAHRHNRDVERVAREMYPDDSAVLKAAVAAGTTAHSTWGGGLVGDETKVFADFVEFLRPMTILGKFGAGGIPSLRSVPFRTALVGQSSGGSGYWVGEGKGIGLTTFDFGRTTLDPLKVGNIAVISQELLESSSPSADVLVRDQLAAALRERMDTDFVDPNKNAGVGSPASITYGVVAIPSSGNDIDAIDDDIKLIMAGFIAANNAPTTGVWIMPATTALALSLMKNALGQRAFPGITINGGEFAGLPTIVSEYVPTDSDGAHVILANAQDIYLGDDGGIAIDISREASLQMDSDPTQNAGSAPPVASQLVSLWQTDNVGFRAQRTINWAKRRPSAVGVLSAVTWGASS